MGLWVAALKVIEWEINFNSHPAHPPNDNICGKFIYETININKSAIPHHILCAVLLLYLLL